jgi:hypothetical protein
MTMAGNHSCILPLECDPSSGVTSPDDAAALLNHPD